MATVEYELQGLRSLIYMRDGCRVSIIQFLGGPARWTVKDECSGQTVVGERKTVAAAKRAAHRAIKEMRG